MRKLLLCALLLAACGDDDGSNACPGFQGPFADGDPQGHPEPLLAGPNQARAGRIAGADLPPVPSGLVTWKDGDFVLANDKVALVIEDVGDSDLYDPWGGRPVGLAKVVNGAMVEPTNFGEFFLLIGRSTVLTEAVTVLADGSDGGPAIIRARGKMHPLPFVEALLGVLFQEAIFDAEGAIDYTLAPGAEHVDITYRIALPRAEPVVFETGGHAFMYTARTPIFQPDRGFDDRIKGAPYVALVDDTATSWAYIPGDGPLGASISASGFVGAFGDGVEIPACEPMERAHAQLVIGGRGVDGVQAAVERLRGNTQREITGTVTRNGAAAAAIHVHAIDNTTDAYLTRATTAADGTFTLHVPASADVRLDAVRIGEPIVSQPIGTASTGTIALPALGQIHVTAVDAVSTTPLPVRVQVLPRGGGAVPEIPGRYGERGQFGGRLQVAFAITGDVTLDVPVGDWEVIVSRGYEYELVRQDVSVVAGVPTVVDALLDHSVDTTNTQCADFHIHTWASNDSGDDSLDKLAQGVADGLELPVRSDHEYVDSFAADITTLDLSQFAAGFGSVEMTSMEIWGHMGVFPLTPDPTRVNNGTPPWQSFPTAAEPAREFLTMSPPAVFDAVRARPESPVVIINHPRGGANYFDYVGFDPATGLADKPEEMDTKFTLVEVFNDSDWVSNRQRNVEDWLGLLRSGRKVFAVGSSDSHGLTGSPIGYPRTCLALGTDVPSQITANQVRDTLAAGHASISGGIYVTAKIGTTGSGETVTGAGSPMMVDVTVQAATWIDVDELEIVVDGITDDVITILPGDADPTDPTIRFSKSIPIQSAATGGFVIVAAYGNANLEPVHPGRKPFGVTNPIFIVP